MEITLYGKRGGVFFPIYIFNVEALQKNGFGDEFMLKYAGHTCQLICPDPFCETAQEEYPVQDLNAMGKGGMLENLDFGTEVENVTVFFATGHSKVASGILAPIDRANLGETQHPTPNAAVRVQCVVTGLNPLEALYVLWFDGAQGRSQAAWAAFTKGLETLSAVQIQQRLAAQGIEIALDAAADLQVEMSAKGPGGVLAVKE